MSRTILVSGMVLMLAWASAGQAKEYQSSFGLTLDIPDNWLVLTKQAITENPALANPLDAKFADINPSVLADLKAKVEGGAIEVLFDRTTSDQSFADNMNVMVKRGHTPAEPGKVRELCDAYPDLLAKYAGRKLAIAKCESRDLGSVKALYVEYEGVVAGTVTMQYQVSRPNEKLLLLTATCKQATLEKVRPDFEAIVRSLKLNSSVGSGLGTEEKPAGQTGGSGATPY
jgi:hypothetical protein